MAFKTFLRKYWPTILTLLVVLYATLWPDPLPDDAPPLFPGADKLIHAVLMGGITGAVFFDIARAKGPAYISPRVIVAVTASVMVFALADEFAQSLMGLGRQSDFLDLFADWAGCLIAAFTAPPVMRIIFRKKSLRK